MDSPSPRRLPVSVLLMLAAVGIPSAAGIAFWDWVMGNPWVALGVAVIYEVSLVILGFTGKVWQKLEDRWVEGTAVWLDSRIQ